MKYLKPNSKELRNKDLPFSLDEDIKIIEGSQKGYLNFIYRGIYKNKQAIIKYFNKDIDFSEERFNSELNAYKKFNGVYAPEMFYYSKDNLILILEFINGETLTNKIIKNGKIDILNISKTIGKIHNNEKRQGNLKLYMGSIINNLNSKLNGLEGDSVKEKQYELLKDGLIYLKRACGNFDYNVNLSMIHGDLNTNNIILNREGKVRAIVDWEFSHVGNRYLDVSHLTNVKDDFSRGFLNGYFTPYKEKFNKKVYDFFFTNFLLKLSLNYFVYRDKIGFINKEKESLVIDKLKILETIINKDKNGRN